MHTQTQPVLWHQILDLLFAPKADSNGQNLTDDSVHKDEEEREEDEARVPHPDFLVDGRDAEEHKDDGFWSVG